MDLTIEVVRDAERAMRAHGVMPPYALRTTPEEAAALLASLPRPARRVARLRARAATVAPLNPGDRVVAKVLDTYIVATRSTVDA